MRRASGLVLALVLVGLGGCITIDKRPLPPARPLLNPEDFDNRVTSPDGSFSCWVTTTLSKDCLRRL